MRPAAIQSATFAAAVCSMIASTMAAADERIAFFEKRVRPTLTAHCYECHGASETMGGLRLDSRAGWQLGGERGPAIVPGKPDESLLIRAIRYADKKLRMPPPDAGGRLTDRQIADLESWIRAGAVDPRAGRPAAAHDFDAAGEHWAFQPIPNAEVPESQHPIDFFVNRNLQKRGFEPTPRASRHTLVRRAVFDLHGLPPTADQYNMSDFGRLVQSLLDSPRYGERWGRHWLDVARYADTKDGVLMYGNDRMRPFAYTYRDYVIRAFNQDKPFDRFVHEQLAADQLGLAPDAPELAALGLLTLGRMFDNNRHDVIDDQIDVVTRGFVGLTVSCARCHDHKFDPIPTADYYSLYGVFASCEQPLQRPRIERPTDKGQEFEKALAEKIEAARKYHDEQYRLIWDTARKRTPDYLVRVATTEPDINETAIFFLSLEPHQLRPQIVYRWRQVIQRRSNRNDPVFGPWFDLVSDPKARAKALADSWRQRNVDLRVIDALVNADPTTPETIARAYGELMVRLFESGDRSQPTKRDEVRDLLVGGSSPIWFLKSQTWHHMSRGEKDTYRGLVRQCDLVAVGQPHAAARAMAIFDADTLYDPVVFQRGDPAQPGQPVARQFLRVLSRGPRQAFPNGSGRLDLAKAITDGRNPLTARVLVNRIWMHHFGEPLVENPSDFGIRTLRPEYAELLDYLASQLIRGGWRLKPLHRLIMTS
ncbi:MAG: DUF1549 domain-containing protein, partial [Planctomycetota bacterium]|nr:DUF1549 domain-containing protein [Planctomycetota bacterium]